MSGFRYEPSHSNKKIKNYQKSSIHTIPSNNHCGLEIFKYEYMTFYNFVSLLFCEYGQNSTFNHLIFNSCAQSFGSK